MGAPWSARSSAWVPRACPAEGAGPGSGFTWVPRVALFFTFKMELLVLHTHVTVGPGAATWDSRGKPRAEDGRATRHRGAALVRETRHSLA